MSLLILAGVIALEEIWNDKSCPRLHESAEFELHELIAKQPEMLDSVVVKQTGQIEAEINALKGEADQLGKEIGELTGEADSGI